MCYVSSFGTGAAILPIHRGTNKMNRISANSRLFTQAKLRLSTLMKKWTAIIYTLTEYEFLILGSKHPTVLFTDHKPIIFLFTQKSNRNHRVYRFQLILMKFPNLYIDWTAGKSLALTNTLSGNTPLELLIRKTTVEIPQNFKFFLAQDEISPRVQCKYAVKTLTEYEILILGSNYLTVLFTDRDPIIFLLTQNSNPKHRDYTFRLFK